MTQSRSASSDRSGRNPGQLPRRSVRLRCKHLGIRAAAVALASAAGTVATVEGNVDLGAVRGLGYKLVGVAGDDAGDPVFELQGNVERHGIVLIGD